MSEQNESFNRKLLRIVRERDSNLCVGLDPDYMRIRTHLAAEVERELRNRFDITEFIGSALSMLGKASGEETDDESHVESPIAAKEAVCKLVIAASAASAAAFKPNAAFFEPDVGGVLGVIDAAESQETEHLLIFDGKRGDIGNTSAQYADAILEEVGFDAVTVNPLMGYDSVEPFLRNPERGAFLLCLTSNPGAQDFLMKNELYKRIAEKAVEWNAKENVGLVVGATRPEYAAEVRAIAPDLPLLIPGVGAQGGALAETLDAIGAKENRAFVINASRSIMFPDRTEGEEYAEAVAAAAATLRDQIRQALR
jgi:orotidine-5'-phosphate decarboxylase